MLDFVVAFSGSASASSIAAIPIVRMASALAINQTKSIWDAFCTAMADEALLRNASTHIIYRGKDNFFL